MSLSMSNPNPRKSFSRFLNRLEDHLPFRSRTPSPAPPTTPIRDGLTTGPANPVDPTVSAAPPKPPATTTSKGISLDEVLAELEPAQQDIIRKYCKQGSSDISSSIQDALQGAEEAQQQYIDGRWKVKAGRNTIVIREKVDAVVYLISTFKNIGSIAVGADPVHAGLPWAGICLLIQIVVAQREQADALLSGLLIALSVQRTADHYHDFCNEQPAGVRSEDLRRHLVKLYAAVMGFLAEVFRSRDATAFDRFCHALLGDDSLRKFPSQCRDILEDVERAASSCDRQLDACTSAIVNETKKVVADIAVQLKDLMAETVEVRTKIDFEKLPTAADAQHDSYQPDLASCLKGTRVDLMDEICHWANDPSGECFYWLQGKAGEGKSTIAKTLAETLEDQHMLGASFFFKRDHADRGNARLFFSTIAAQLATKIDGLESAIAKVLDGETRRYDKGIQIQFEKLIAAPLRDLGQPLPSKSGGLIIVVDALDECFEGDIKQVIHLLAQAEDFSIKTFITSRPDGWVPSALAPLKGTQCRRAILETHTQAAIGRDISLFLHEKLRDLRSDRPDLAIDWPGQHRIEELTRRSVPLFIFAATVCRFLLDPYFTPEELLHAVLAESSLLPLTMTYRPIMERWLEARVSREAPRVLLQSKEAAMAEFRRIVGPILLSAEPLPVNPAARVSGLKIDELESRLIPLHSVLQTSKHDGEEHYTIKAFHLSFQDFLVKSGESLEFRIQEQQTHELMAASCLSLLMSPGKLRQDICAVSKPGTRRLDVDPGLIKSHIDPVLAYACRHWMYHQVRSGGMLDNNPQVYGFFTSNFLYWFEAMAWLGKAYQILPVLRQLKLFIDDTCSVKLRELVEDVHYFIRDFSYIANQAPLQLYASALTFAPESSQVKSLFKDCMPRWLVLPPKVADVWGMKPLVFEGHTGVIKEMSFSPGGQYLATCSTGDETLRVWHTATGGCTLEIPRSERGQPVAISFSHDSRYIAAAYVGRGYLEKDLSLLAVIYDINTGNVIETYAFVEAALATRTNMIHLAFASGLSNTLFVASVSIEGDLEIWCTKLVSHTFEKAWSVPTGIRIQRRELFTISVNSSLVSCFSHNDRSITSWRLESGAYVSSHSIELDGDLFWGFLEHRGSDLIYSTLREKRSADDGQLWLGRPNVQKLNTRTGQVDCITYMKKPWLPQAISLTTGAIAYTKDYLDVVYMVDLLQCPKTDNLTSYASSSLKFVSVSQNGEMVLMVYHDHLELRDVLGNIVFRSLKANLEPFREVACVSGDGSVVAACLTHGSHFWFVKSGRELQLPDVKCWPCSPAVSGDGKLMAFFADDSRESSGGNVTYQLRVGRMFVWDLENDQEGKAVDRSNTFDFSGAWMLFSGDNKTLHTHGGDLDLETGDWKPGRLDVPIGRKSKKFISDDNSWLQSNGKDMLWLPESYRPQYGYGEHFGKNTIAYLSQDDRVVVMQCVDSCE